MMLSLYVLMLAAPPAVSEPSTAKPRLAVMTFKSVGTPAGFAEGLTETFATAATDVGVFDVVSPRQVAAVLAYEKRKELLGSCAEEACYLQVAKLVNARHIVGGSIAQVGDRLVLNVVLIDGLGGQALERRQEERPSAAGLIAGIRRTAVLLLQPLLQQRQGYLRVTLNVPDADLVVDDRLRQEKGGQVIALAAGPHVLRVDKSGFYSANADIMIRPGRMLSERVDLIPALATVEAYERRATWMRAGAWTTAALAVASAVGAGIFYDRATGNKDFTDRYSTTRDIDRLQLGGYDRYLEERDAFDTNQGLYLGLLIGAIVSGAASTYLFIAGDPPGRYADFASVAENAGANP